MDGRVKVDVCIVGAGLAGGVLAWALAQQGKKVCLLDAFASSQKKPKDIYGERSIALSYGSKALLDQLGLWDAISTHAVPIEHIHISERSRFGAARLHADEQKLDALGYVVLNSHFVETINELIADSAAIKKLAPASVESLVMDSNVNELEIIVNEKLCHISASLLIAADGSDSKVAKLLNVKSKAVDYKQSAIVANLRTEKHHGFTAYERFTESGPLALLPLEGNFVAMVYTVEQKDLESTLKVSDEKFLSMVQNNFGYRLGRFEQTGPRAGFGLQLKISEPQIQGRALLMGNAARTLHPVSGQGFNLALRDIALLIELSSEQSDLENADIQAILTKFIRQREKDQNRVVGFTDALVKIFRGKSPGFCHLRAAGLLAVDHVPVLKNILVNQSTGMNNPLPKYKNPS